MKKTVITSILLSALAVNLHALNITGTAATSVTNLVAGNSTFVIVDTSGADTLTSSAFTSGLTLTSGGSFGNYYVASYNAVVGGFGTTIPGNANFNLGDGSTSAGDTFYIVAFGTKSGDGITLSGGDTFGILAGSDWVLNANNSATEIYGSDLQQFSTANGAEFSIAVVPEPSTFAALTGLCALGAVMVRRRRA